MAGAGDNVTGGMGNFVQNASVAYLQELGANQVKQIADALDSDTARAALHAVVGCAGAAASSQSCASGALGAAGGSIINNLLDQINKDKLTPEEREARSNLVSSLIAGITAAAGGSAVTATNAARIETENNRLATSAEVKRIHQLSQGDPRKEARLTAAACALLHCEREYPEGSEAYNFYKRLSDAGNSPELAEERLLLQSQKGFQFRAGLITGLTLEPLFQYNLISDNLADAAKRVDNTYQLGTRTLGGVQAVGGAATAIAGGTITAGGAASCGSTAGAGCLAAAGGVALSFWGLDQAKAGVATMISGQPQATVGGIVLQQVFGISPQAAELLYGMAGLTPGVTQAVLANRVVNAEAAANAAARGTYSTTAADAGTAASASPKPPLALPAPQPGTVIRNAMSDAEVAQAQDIVNFKGGTFKGAPTGNYPGIDGWLNDVPVQLKEVTGKSMSAIQRNIVGAASDMSKAGYVGDVYIDATKTGVSMNEITNFVKPGTPISNILGEGTVLNINIKTADGWLKLTQTTLKVPR
ncbi:VENN motif pre-toxin domain-containing protein [Ralstonia solanacearum]|uniref:Putative hemagglutinin-related protein n=1 Tax=Ralstonia solanacearum CFBP2957 TaxID=859656 RepID=D8P511_RALSL